MKHKERIEKMWWWSVAAAPKSKNYKIERVQHNLAGNYLGPFSIYEGFGQRDWVVDTLISKDNKGALTDGSYLDLTNPKWVCSYWILKPVPNDRQFQIYVRR